MFALITGNELILTRIVLSPGIVTLEIAFTLSVRSPLSPGPECGARPCPLCLGAALVPRRGLGWLTAEAGERTTAEKGKKEEWKLGRYRKGRRRDTIK